MVPFMDTVTGSGEKIRETKRPTTVRLAVYELYNIIQRPPLAVRSSFYPRFRDSAGQAPCLPKGFFGSQGRILLENP